MMGLIGRQRIATVVDIGSGSGLSKEEKEVIRETFEIFDKDADGYLSPQELKRCLEELGQHPTEEEILKMINEIDQNNKGCLDYNDFERAMALHKNTKNNNAEDDTSNRSLVRKRFNHLLFLQKVDAFVAMGGSPDGKGYVNATKLINVVRDEFQMTIDIERLIREIDDNKSDKIEFDEFKNLLN